MNRLRIALIGLALTVLPASCLAQEPPSDPLQPFSRFVGGAWVSEGDFRVRIVYEWGLNRKLLKIRSYLITENVPKLMYESSVYHHPEKKQVVFQSVSAQGGLFDGVMTHKDNVFTTEFTSYAEGKATPFRQTLEFLDDDHVLWTVLAQKDGAWTVLHHVKEHRDLTLPLDPK